MLPAKAVLVLLLWQLTAALPAGQQVRKGALELPQQQGCQKEPHFQTTCFAAGHLDFAME